MHEAGHGPADIRVTGRQWWFDAEYLSDQPYLRVHAPTEIHIPVGRPVDIELVSRDVIHSFWVPKLQGKVDLVPGMVNRIRLHADRADVFEGECAEFCGRQHAQMRVQIVAEPPEVYEAWLQSQRSPATAPATAATSNVSMNANVAYGSEVFQSAACPLCHTIRGTLAQGRIGPDLTHVGSRRRIAGGTLVSYLQSLQ